MATRATAYLAEASELFLTDLIVAETVYVLESFYEAPREQVAAAMRSLVSMRSVVTVDPALLLRSIEVHENDRLDFAEAYLEADRPTDALTWRVSSTPGSREHRGRTRGVVRPCDRPGRHRGQDQPLST